MAWETTVAKDFNTEGKAAIGWTRLQLTTVNAEFLKELPLSIVSDDVVYVHVSPGEPEAWNYIATWHNEARTFDHFATAFCCIDHTHPSRRIGRWNRE